MPKTLRPASAAQRSALYARPSVKRFGTLRELTREGFTGNTDGGLILGPDGNTTAAADPVTTRGSR